MCTVYYCYSCYCALCFHNYFSSYTCALNLFYCKFNLLCITNGRLNIKYEKCIKRKSGLYLTILIHPPLSLLWYIPTKTFTDHIRKFNRPSSCTLIVIPKKYFLLIFKLKPYLYKNIINSIFHLQNAYPTTFFHLK
jgi:hypothetical protein